MDILWGQFRSLILTIREGALPILGSQHSNAREERVFSMIRKNKTYFGLLLQLDGSLNSIMRTKMTTPEDFTWQLPEE